MIKIKTFLCVYHVDPWLGPCHAPRGMVGSSAGPCQCWQGALYWSVQPVWVAATESCGTLQEWRIPTNCQLTGVHIIFALISNTRLNFFLQFLTTLNKIKKIPQKKNQNKTKKQNKTKQPPYMLYLLYSNSNSIIYSVDILSLRNFKSARWRVLVFYHGVL